MTNYEKIQKANPQLTIYQVGDEQFRDYGIVYKQFDLTEINDYMARVAVTAANQYVPKNPAIEQMSVIHEISGEVFGGMALSAGQCVGHCDAFSAVEFHQGSEVNITFTDVIMVLGKRRDLQNYEFHAVDDAQIFYIPQGTVFEMFSDTLHYSPIEVTPAGFKAVVVVLNGTNESLPSSFKTHNPMLVKKNKFQLAHATRTDKVKAGILPGVKGPLVQVRPIQD